MSENEQRPRSRPSQTVTLKLPQEAMRRAKGAESENRGKSVGPLGNEGALREHLAKHAVKGLGELLEGTDEVVITADGDIRAKDTPDRDESGRWLPGGGD